MYPLQYVQLTRLPHVIIHTKLLTPFPVPYLLIDQMINLSVYLFLITKAQIGVILCHSAEQSRQGVWWRYRSPHDMQNMPLHQASEDLSSDPPQILISCVTWKESYYPSGLWATQLVSNLVWFLGVWGQSHCFLGIHVFCRGVSRVVKPSLLL